MIDQPIRNTIEYGTMVDTSVPMPTMGAWRWKKAMIQGEVAHHRL